LLSAGARGGEREREARVDWGRVKVYEWCER